MYLPIDIYADILNSMNCLLFSRYINNLFYALAQRLLKKTITRNLSLSREKFLRVAKWIPKEFRLNITIADFTISNISFLESYSIYYLDIGFTQILEVPSFIKNSGIESLSIYSTLITNLDSLNGITTIKKLDISCTSITDLMPLRNCKLEYLNTSFTKIEYLYTL